MSKDDVAKAVLGQLPAALAETVSLATPLTMSRIEGQDEAAAVLREIAESLRICEQEFIANDDERAFVTFVCTGQGGEVGLFAVLTKGSEGTYSAVDLYARPGPFVKMVRDHLAVSDERFRELVSVILKAVGEIAGAPRFRVVSRFGEAYVVMFDATVHGNTWQLAGVYGLDDAGKIADMRLYSRPWPVTAFFRGEAYKLMRDQFGPEYWQGENPLVTLGEA